MIGNEGAKGDFHETCHERGFCFECRGKWGKRHMVKGVWGIKLSPKAIRIFF